MSPQQFIELYGKSVYDVRLEVALRCLSTGSSPEQSLSLADEFVEVLLAENLASLDY